MVRFCMQRTRGDKYGWSQMKIEENNKYSFLHFVDARILGLVTFILYILIYIVPLEARPLFVPDKARYGEISREMVDRGDWLKLRLAGLPYYAPPPWAIGSTHCL